MDAAQADLAVVSDTAADELLAIDTSSTDDVPLLAEVGMTPDLGSDGDASIDEEGSTALDGGVGDASIDEEGSTALDSSVVGDGGPGDSGPCLARRCGLEIACGSTDDGCGHVVDCGSCGPTVTLLDVAGRHLIYDDSRGKLYATVGTGSASASNGVVAIDISSHQVSLLVSLGPDVGPMALSDDRATLWVGVGTSVARVDLGTIPATVAARNMLPCYSGDCAAAGSIVPVPGLARSIAVTLITVEYHSSNGAVVLDDGVPRPDRSLYPTQIIPGPPGYLFGCDNLFGLGFQVLTISSSGLATTDYVAFFNYMPGDIAQGGGRVFISDGEVIDVSDPTHPAALPALPLFGPAVVQPNGGAVVVTAAGYHDARTAVLHVIDGETLGETAAVSVPGVTDTVTRSPVQISDDTVAFLADGATTRLVIVSDPALRLARESPRP